jgi:WD40 repeat protein
VDASTGKELATLTNPDPHRITKLCFSPDDGQLAVATENYGIHLWDLPGLRAQLAELGLDWDWPP